MSLEDRFRKLGQDTEESIKRREQAAKDAIREAQETIKALSPGVARVCNLFCGAVKWTLTVWNSEIERAYILDDNHCRFKVTIHKGGVDVAGDYTSHFGHDDQDWHTQTTIRLEDFTDDKLAQLFEKWYREHILITY